MAKKFSFANLLGGGKNRADESNAAEDEDQMDAEDAGEEEEQAADDAATSGDGGESAEGDGDDAAAAEDGEEDGGEEASAFVKGRMAERGRIGAILSSGAVTASNLEQALHIACNTDLKSTDVVSVLKAAPSGGSRLSQAMKGRGPQPISAPAAGGNDDDKAAARILSVAGHAKRKEN